MKIFDTHEMRNFFSQDVAPGCYLALLIEILRALAITGGFSGDYVHIMSETGDTDHGTIPGSYAASLQRSVM